MRSGRDPERLLAAFRAVDVHDLDDVVAVAQAVPRGWIGLHVPGGVGRPGPQRVPSDGDNGSPGNVSSPVVVGFGGWGDFKTLCARGDRIYAVVP